MGRSGRRRRARPRPSTGSTGGSAGSAAAAGSQAPAGSSADASSAPADPTQDRAEDQPRPKPRAVPNPAGARPGQGETQDQTHHQNQGRSRHPSQRAQTQRGQTQRAQGQRAQTQRAQGQRTQTQRAQGQRTQGQRAQPQPGQTAHVTHGRAGQRRGRWLRQVDEFSAGGLVLDMKGEIPRGALIARTDRHGRLLWSLPKGHIEAGETAEQAAVREVEEETGISGVIVAELGTIDFWFIAEGRRIHKTVRHYLMRATGGELSDADIEVTEVAWVPLPDIRAQLAYPDERGLVDTAGRLLADAS